MVKHYTVSKTTRVQREKIANDALGLSMLDAPEPTMETQSLVRRYVEGHMEIADALTATLNRYRKRAS